MKVSNEDSDVDHIILLTEGFLDLFESSKRAHKGWHKHRWLQIREGPKQCQIFDEQKLFKFKYNGRMQWGFCNI